jgi:hypothetical protein
MFELKWPPLKIGDMVRVNDKGMRMYPEVFSEKICGEIVAIIGGVHIGVKFPAGSIEGHHLDGIIAEDSGWWLLEEYVDRVSSAEESER